MIRNSIHIILAIWILTTSSGLVMNLHFCQNELKTVSLFMEAEPCHSGMPMDCPMHAGSHHQQDKKKDCCDNKTEYIKLSQLYSEKNPDLVITPLNGFPVIMDQTPLSADLFSELLHPHYQNYKPPLLVCNYTVSLQTFLC